jgi:hypothetical protein
MQLQGIVWRAAVIYMVLKGKLVLIMIMIMISHQSGFPEGLFLEGLP